MERKLFWTGILFITPITLILFTFLFLPILQSLFYSMTDWRGVGAYHFIGLQNYKSIFTDDLFIHSLTLTMFIGISAALFANIFGLAFGVMLDQSFKTKNILRALFYLPNVIPIVVAAFVWRYMMDANSGLVNVILSDLVGKKVTIPWIDSPQYVGFSIVLITVWQMMGPIIIIYLAALQGVPHELKESAMIDGASKLRTFFSVTFPMIAPGVTVNVLIGLANGIRIFDLPFALTGGGPANSSETLAIRIYEYAFQSANLGYGMSTSFVLTLVALVITIFFVVLSRRYEREAHGA